MQHNNSLYFSITSVLCMHAKFFQHRLKLCKMRIFSMFLFSGFEPVSLRWVIILSIGGGILLIILSTFLYCWIRRKNAQRIRSENNGRQANYRPGTSRSGRRGNNSSARNSSVQDRDSSISMRDTDTTSLPPSYEEAQLHHYITKLT